MCVWRGLMLMCVYMERIDAHACVYMERIEMFMHVCMERMIYSCVWIVLSLVFVCEQLAICFAKMLIHFHFGKTGGGRKGPNFRIGHAEIFYRPLHACIDYVVLINF